MPELKVLQVGDMLRGFKRIDISPERLEEIWRDVAEHTAPAIEKWEREQRASEEAIFKDKTPLIGR